VASALFDNHTGELIDAVMSDILAALDRPGHPDADALMGRARTNVYESFEQSEISDEAAEWVFKVMVGFGLRELAAGSGRMEAWTSSAPSSSGSSSSSSSASPASPSSGLLSPTFSGATGARGNSSETIEPGDSGTTATDPAVSIGRAIYGRSFLEARADPLIWGHLISEHDHTVHRVVDELAVDGWSLTPTEGPK
jgi:hypothetical protein